ncbi:MAG: methyltransferase [Armatimonadetes bacterium]|nr:methyltransferase [Armatimonadota bacterium]
MSPKENLLRTIARDQPAWVPNGLESVVTLGPPVVERPGAAGYDAFGVHWSYDPAAEGGTYPTRGGHPVTDLRRWREQVTIPDVAALDWSAVRGRGLAIDRETHLVQGFVEMGLFERAYLLLGMEEALMAFVGEPEAMADLLGALADYKIALISAFDDAVPLDLLWYGDDWGTQTDLFVSPAVWRALLRPPLARIYACAHERGILVNQHSCGRIERIFGDIVALGAALWNPCQPCNDLAALKLAYGDRIAFHGGIDSQFVLDRPGVTPDEVRAEVRRRIDELGAGGGYIAGPSHGVPYDPDLIAAMNDEIAAYGR